MGSIKAVFDKWRHNLANKIRKQPSMPWSSGGAPVTSTRNFQIFGDLVIVTIRNRRFHAGVTLKNAIAEMRKAAPGITTFDCLFCRVTDGYTDDKWCALNGRWE